MYYLKYRNKAVVHTECGPWVLKMENSQFFSADNHQNSASFGRLLSVWTYLRITAFSAQRETHLQQQPKAKEENEESQRKPGEGEYLLCSFTIAEVFFWHD